MLQINRYITIGTKVLNTQLIMPLARPKKRCLRIKRGRYRPRYPTNVHHAQALPGSWVHFVYKCSLGLILIVVVVYALIYAILSKI